MKNKILIVIETITELYKKEVKNLTVENESLKNILAIKERTLEVVEEIQEEKHLEELEQIHSVILANGMSIESVLKLTDRIEELENEIYELESRVDELENDNYSLETEKTELEERVQELERERDNLEDEKNELESQIEDMER